MKIIELFQENSGAIDEKGFKTVLKDLIKIIKTGIYKLEDDYFLANLVESKRKFSYTFNYDSKPDIIFSSFPLNYKISIKFSLRNDERPVVCLGGRVELDKTNSDITIFLNINKTVEDLKKDFVEVEGVIAHELVHIFKFLRGEYQKGGGEFIHKGDGQTYKTKKYLTCPSEIDAFITQMNVGMREIKEKNPEIDFAVALKKNKVFVDYIRKLNDCFNIGNYNPLYIKDGEPTAKLKRYILKKIAYYWNNELK